MSVPPPPPPPFGQQPNYGTPPPQQQLHYPPPPPPLQQSQQPRSPPPPPPPGQYAGQMPPPPPPQQSQQPRPPPPPLQQSQQPRSPPPPGQYAGQVPPPPPPGQYAGQVPPPPPPPHQLQQPQSPSGQYAGQVPPPPPQFAGMHQGPPPPQFGGMSMASPPPIAGRPPIPPNATAPGMVMSPAPTYAQPPHPGVPGSPPPRSPDSTTGHSHHPRRRLYPQAQATAYGVAPPSTPGAPAYGQPSQPQAPQAPQFFVPGDTGATPTFVPAHPGLAASPVPAAGGAPGSAMHALQQQFGQMGISGTSATSNLFPVQVDGVQPDVLALDAPPPPIRVPPQASVTQSPYVTCPPEYSRATTNSVPATPSLVKKTRLPLGLLITPCKSLGEGEAPVPTVNEITRCRRCRTYINPFVQFVDDGRRWKCNMCFIVNDVPHFFDYSAGEQRMVNRWERAELNHAVVEYIAPAEYMVRPPQPPVFLFVIDVSYAAIQSGMVEVAAKTILENLDRIPNNDKRVKFGFITVDTSLHFYSLKPNQSEPQMIVMSDMDDVFLPLPEDLLVTLEMARDAIVCLLERLPNMFKNTHVTGNALGTALQAASKLVSPIGGKIVVLQNSLPTLHEGALKAREDPKMLGTTKESSLLLPAAQFYKTFAVDCSRSQVCIDVFLFSSQYTDVATLSCLPKFTGGQTYYYPGFNAQRPEDAEKFAHEFSHFLQNETGLEAVLRIRASRGIRMTAFHGNFFLRSMDLLALPNVTPDHCYGVEYTIDEEITTPLACFQTAVLHTSCHGERRIRVITHALPVVSTLAEVYASADQVAIASLLAKKAVERSLSSKLEDAREAVSAKCIEIAGIYKTELTAAGSGASVHLQLSENLKLLPLLTLGLLKHVALRGGSQIPTDLRSYAMNLLYVMPPELLIPYLHPRFYALHTMPPEVGTPGPDGRIIMPVPLNLSSERLERGGAFLLDDGQTTMLWVGRDVSPRLLQDLLGVQSYEGLRGGKMTLPDIDHDFSRRVRNILAKLREQRRNIYYPHLYLVKEDGEPSLRLWFLSHLIEDRAGDLSSYPQWIAHVKEKVNAGSY